MIRKGENHKIPTMAGFTLLEILVSISIFAVLATIVYSSLNAVLSKNEAIKGSTTAFEMAKNTMNRISRDLTTAFVIQYPEYQVPGLNDDPDIYRFNGEEAFLSFVSTEHLGISTEVDAGLARIMYYPEKIEDRQAETLVLKRSEIPFPYDIDPGRQTYSTESFGNDPVICENIDSFSLAYVDEKGETHQSWDSDSETHQYATPRAVIINLSVATENGIHDFSTRVDIPVYRKGVENVRRQ
jgi:general secretion pathway protein J